MTKNQLLKKIKSRMKETGTTQEMLADKIGTKHTNISRTLSGRVDVRLSTLLKIGGVVGLKLRWEESCA